MEVTTIQGWLDEKEISYNLDLMKNIITHKLWTTDPQCPSSRSMYGLHWQLLEDKCDLVSEIFGKELAPAYTYARCYPPNEVLRFHNDRKSCEYSLTINLCNEDNIPWEFFWGTEEREILGSMVMRPGDAVFYEGAKVWHWREPNPSPAVWQVFLHYVDTNGPYRNWQGEYMRRLPGYVNILLDKEMDAWKPTVEVADSC